MLENPPSGAIRIFHVVTGWSAGGMEHVLAEMLHRSRSEQFDHWLCVGGRIAPDAPTLPTHVKVLQLGRGTSNRLLPIKLARAMIRHRPRIAAVYNYGAWADMALACRVAGVRRWFLAYHGIGQAADFSWLRRRWLKRLGRATPLMVTVAAAAAERARRDTGIGADRTVIIPNGVDMSRFAPAETLRQKGRNAFGLAEKVPVIGTIAKFRPVKRLDLLLKAFAAVAGDHPKAVLLMVGEGPGRGELESQAKGLGISGQVCFTGFVRRAEPLLAAMDLFVLSSEIECLSMSILEALGSGKPILATDVGANRELIEPGVNGWLVRPGDSRGLAGAMAEALAEPDVLPEMGEHSRNICSRRYTVETMVQRYENLYRLLDETDSPKTIVNDMEKV